MFLPATPTRTESFKRHHLKASNQTNFDASSFEYLVGMNLGQSGYSVYKLNLCFWHRSSAMDSILYTTVSSIPNSSSQRECEHLFIGNGRYLQSSWRERNNRREIQQNGGNYFVENQSELRGEIIERIQFIKGLYDENKISFWEQSPLLKAMEVITSGSNKTIYHSMSMGGK